MVKSLEERASDDTCGPAPAPHARGRIKKGIGLPRHQGFLVTLGNESMAEMNRWLGQRLDQGGERIDVHSILLTAIVFVANCAKPIAVTHDVVKWRD
jgi:hypothetical protein